MADLAGRSVWPYWLGASAIAICSAELGFTLTSGPERYAQFTVGSLTWRAGSKHADYALLVGLLAGFAIAWMAFMLLERRVVRRLGEDGVDHLRSLLAYVSLPFVIWMGGLVIGTSNVVRDLVWLSAAGVCIACALMLIATTGRPAAEVHETAPGTAAGYVMLAIVFGALSPLIAVLAINRIGIPRNHALLWTGTPTPMVMSAAGALLAFVVGLIAWKAGSRTSRQLAIAIGAAQLVLPWGYLIVVPTPWAYGTFVQYAGPMSKIPWLVFALVAAAYVDLFRRLPFFTRRTPPESLPSYALSPLALAGGLVFVKLAPILVQQLSADDYHFGEYLLPGWSLGTFGAIPFWDYVPARGLVNYIDGTVAALTFGHSAAGIASSISLVSTLIFIVGLVAMAMWIGLLPAAAAFLMVPLEIQPTQVDIINTSVFVLLLVLYRRLTPAIWLLAWVALGTLAFLMAPAQGTILVVATMPLGAWQGIQAIRDDRARAVRLGAAAALIAIVLVLATPLGRMLLGALRYAREHSTVGGPAHGLEWALSAGSFPSLNRWLFESVRASWMLVGMAGTALIATAWTRKEMARRDALLLTGLPIVIMAAFFIYRAAGRIDPGWVTRLGLASVWMLTLLVPLLLHAAWGARRWPVILTITVAGGALFTPSLGGLLSLQAIGRRALELEQGAGRIVRGFSADLPNVGRAGIVKERLEFLGGIYGELAVLLDPHETYLDLTNRNAEYFYLGREVPIESGAIYNLPDDRQQLRAVARLRRQQTPVVLAVADGQIYDGALPSYRTYSIYRYLVWNYVPVRIDKRIYLVKPDRMQRLDREPGLRTDRSDPASLLDAAFRTIDLQGLAAAWGSSWRSLEAAVTPVRDLGPPSTVLNANAVGGTQYDAGQATAILGWDLSSFPAGPLAGKDAGILTFDLACLAGPGGTPIEVRWAARGAVTEDATTVRFQGSPRLAVPLDAAPRWLLAPALATLEIRIIDPTKCSRFSVSNVKLWQRRVAAEADAH